jgi:hypothetical protein
MLALFQDIIHTKEEVSFFMFIFDISFLSFKHKQEVISTISYSFK